MLVSTWRETEYRLDALCATNGVHVEIYWAQKKLCKVQCLEKYQLLQCTLWLEMYVLFKAEYLY
jgi:hypothetical protein